MRGLPKDLRSYKGDEATSWNQVVKTASSAFEAAVDRRKPLITVWDEKNGPIAENEYEWSFGNGGGNTDGGYPMLAAGRVLRMGLAATTSGSAPAAASVNIVVSGVANMSYGVTKPSGQYSSTSTFRTPLELARGDIINFRSASVNTEVTTAVVSLLIELLNL